MGDGWEEYTSYSDTPEDIYKILKKGDDYRLVKTMTIWDFGILERRINEKSKQRKAKNE